MPQFDGDRGETLLRAREAGVRFLEVGCDEESSARSVRLAKKVGGVAAVGIHPHYSFLPNSRGAPRERLEQRWKEIENLAFSNPGFVVAVGEMGLDYFRNPVPPDIQKDCFQAGLLLARKTGLPAIIHQRNAETDTLRVLSDACLSVPIVFHCFSQNASYARECLELGGYFGIGGVLTYPRNSLLRGVVGTLPKDRILVETDCPYLAPQAHRGKRNEPAYVRDVVKALSGILNMKEAEVAELTTQNARLVFGRSFRGNLWE